MRISKGFKKAMACVLSMAMAVTMLPTGNLQNVKAASTDSNMVLHWDMTQDEDGKLIDLTGNNNNGIVNGAVEAGEIEGVTVQKLNGGYVVIPDGTITDDMSEVTINMLVKIQKNEPASWMWCLGTSSKRYLYFTGCCSSNQGSKMRGGACFVPDSGGNGWEYESVVAGNEALSEGVWQNITVTYKDGEYYKFYQNGELNSSIYVEDGPAKGCKLQEIMKAGDGLDGYMGWSFYTGQDPKFKGSVADFRIYNKELSKTEVSELYTEVNDMLESLASGDFSSADINLTESDCLGTNTSATAVTTDLVLPTKTTIGKYNMAAEITAWSSDNPDVISDTGKVTRRFKDTTVTLTADVTCKSRTEQKQLTFKVLGTMTDEDAIKEDTANLDIYSKDDIRGNITLPDKGENGCDITWKSSNEAVISTVAKGSMAPGVVNRQAADTNVTLTATITRADLTETKEFLCTVKKAPKEVVTTDYLFAYFPYTSTKDERIYFGISEDGLVFNALNDSKFVLESVEGTHGLRDPFVIRSKEGDKFYLIATDLTVAGITQGDTTYPGQNWDKNQTEGSQCIMVWESEDLVNWSKQRMCHVAADNAGCAWAPEAYYDDTTGEYLVFWASKTGDDGYAKQRVWCATTRDFNTFSEPEVWIEASGSVIDTTVMKAGDYYYRYTKNEDGSTINGTPTKRVYCERSKSLKGTWERVANNSLPVSGGQIEGPTIYKINDDDVENAKEVAGLLNITLEGDQIYCLAADQTGSTIFPGLTDDITSGEFNPLGTSKTVSIGGRTIYAMPDPDASHGTIMPITAEEYNNLMLAYDSAYAENAQEYVQKAQEAKDALTLVEQAKDDIVLPTTVSGNTVTWESNNTATISDTGKVTKRAIDMSVEMTATIVVKGSGTVRDQIVTKSFVVTVPKDEAKESQAKEKAQNVAALIAAIGDVNYDEASKRKIDTASEAYKALEFDEKTFVSDEDVKTLEQAISDYSKLDADWTAVNAVVAKINEIGTVTLASEEAIAEARVAYNGLTEEQKELVDPKEYAKLTAAEKTYVALVAAAEKAEADKAAANAVVAKINAIGTVTLTTACKTAIDAARAAYNGLTPDRKALITAAQLKVLTDAEAKYAALVVEADKKPLTVGTKKTVADANYVVTNATNGAAEVAYAGPVSKKIKTGKVPTTVAIDGVTYKVTKISDNAFKRCTKMTKITVPLGITEIGKNAFSGCKSLKTITIKSTTLKKVGKSAFKGISKKATIKVPKKNKKAYQKLFKKKGQASTVKIK